MSEPFVGEIRMFAGNFAIRGWAKCDGQILAITSNEALFSLLGTTYGGDGRTTFALPDLRGRLAVGVGSGPGLTTRSWGQRSGVEQVALTGANLPTHTHTVKASGAAGTTANPAAGYPAAVPLTPRYQNVPGGSSADASMKSDAVGLTGTPDPTHNNIQPFTSVTFLIALFGIFPSRN